MQAQVVTDLLVFIRTLLPVGNIHGNTKGVSEMDIQSVSAYLQKFLWVKKEKIKNETFSKTVDLLVIRIFFTINVVSPR